MLGKWKKAETVLSESTEDKNNSVLINGIVDIRVSGQSVEFVLSGRIDNTNFEDIEKEAMKYISSDGMNELVFNMNQVIYVNSKGLKTFAKIGRLMIEENKKYRLIEMRGDLLKMFQMTGYASQFIIEPIKT